MMFYNMYTFFRIAPFTKTMIPKLISKIMSEIPILRCSTLRFSFKPKYWQLQAAKLNTNTKDTPQNLKLFATL